ncbi:hypothetical protein JHW43_003657 [Diplocarpon mali]|nr:hypothetical protein JHW43_003657 [Diplocarpon mali]
MRSWGRGVLLSCSPALTSSCSSPVEGSSRSISGIRAEWLPSQQQATRLAGDGSQVNNDSARGPSLLVPLGRGRWRADKPIARRGMGQTYLWPTGLGRPTISHKKTPRRKKEKPCTRGNLSRDRMIYPRHTLRPTTRRPDTAIHAPNSTPRTPPCDSPNPTSSAPRHICPRAGGLGAADTEHTEHTYDTSTHSPSLPLSNSLLQ